MITDYLLGILTLYLGSRLRKARLIAVAFFFVGVSALLSGTWHGFHTQLPPSSAHLLWVVAMCFLYGFSLCIIIGTINLAIKKPKLRKVLIALYFLKFFVFILWYITDSSSFIPPFYDYSISLTGVLIIALCKCLKNKAYLWIAGGVITAYVAGTLWLLNIPSGKVFDHNDLFHLIQMISALFLFLGYFHLNGHSQAANKGE